MQNHTGPFMTLFTTMVTKTLLLTLLFIAPLSGQAQTVSDVGYIGEVFVFSTAYGFTLQEGFINAASEHGCAGPGGFARIPIDGNQNSKEMYSAVLTAMASNKNVRINTDGCSGNHFRVLGIYVESD